jgi:hypothetical protein
MAQLFAPVELRGTPGEHVYEQLHTYMASLNWLQTIDGFTEAGDQITLVLPHATYQGHSVSDSPDVRRMAADLRSHIESTIWTPAIVLVIRGENWGQAG